MFFPKLFPLPLYKKTIEYMFCDKNNKNPVVILLQQNFK